VNSKAEDSSRPSSGDSDPTASRVAHSAAKPCPPECGSGPTVSRGHRSRDAATVARNARLRSTFKRYFSPSQNPLDLSASHEEVRPRGPPSVS
jgi:hypothetical protein